MTRNVAMSDTLEIRPIQSSHVKGFHRALDVVAREKDYLTFLEAPSIEETEEFVNGNITGNNTHLVALVKNEVIGWCDIRRHYFQSHAHRGTLGMGIIPEHRGKGIGFRLIKSALESANENGMTRIEFSVRADNARAIALYQKVGFEEEGTHIDAVYVDGKYYDTITMALVCTKK